MIIEISKRDMAQNTLVEPAWYLVQIDGVEDRISNDGKSTNSWISGHIIRNADTGDEKFAEVPTPYLWLINSGNPVGLTSLLLATGYQPEAGKRFDLDALAGKQLEMFIGNGLYQGVMKNTTNHQYRLVGAGR